MIFKKQIELYLVIHLRHSFDDGQQNPLHFKIKP